MQELPFKNLADVHLNCYNLQCAFVYKRKYDTHTGYSYGPELIRELMRNSYTDAKQTALKKILKNTL